MTEPLVSVRQLSVSISRNGDSTLAVEDVRLDLEAGRIAGIVGETGAGKTLTTRAMLGLLPRHTRASGRMSLEDRSFDLANPATLRPLLGREVAAVFQNPSGMLDPLLRIERQLVEGVVRHKRLTAPAAVDRARKLLRDVGFRDVDRVMRSYPHELSGGMSQRVAIVMALMSGPKLLVVDEPTSALDANVRIEVMERLSQLADEEGAAVLLVSHDLGLISRFCDEITVLYGGHVLEQGPARDVVMDPAHPYTRALLSCAPDWHRPARRPLTTIEGKPPLPGAWPRVCIFSPRCPVVCERGLMERPALMSVGSRACACFRAAGQPTAAQGSRS